MARDNRKINRGVWADGVLYTAGQEDELAAVLKPEQVGRLTENGTLEGDWHGKSKATVATETAASGEVQTSSAATESKPPAAATQTKATKAAK